MNDFISIEKYYPATSCEVKVLIEGRICVCQYNKRAIEFIFPNGFFQTFYGMVIPNVTHWRLKTETK